MEFNLPETQDQPLYAVLDAALIDELSLHIYQHQPSGLVHPVYLNTELANLLEVSPYLVALNPGDPLSRWILDVALPQKACLLFTSNASQDTLIQHWQWLRRAYHPSGALTLFRFYDPRVNKVLLDASETPQRSELMGPMEAIYFVDVSGEQTQDEICWECVTNPKVDSEKADKKRDFYPLSEPQLLAMGAASREAQVERLAAAINEHFPDKLEGDGLAQAERYIRACDQHGFSGEQALLQYTHMVCTLGEDCYQEGKYPELRTLVTQSSQHTPNQRIEQAANLATTLSA